MMIACQYWKALVQLLSSGVWLLPLIWVFWAAPGSSGLSSLSSSSEHSSSYRLSAAAPGQ